MKTEEMYRQGDLLFRVVKEIPQGGKKRVSGHILEGEVTGHIHKINEEGVIENHAEVLECGDGLFLAVSESGVSIVHEDHATLELPAGNYEIVRQREYSPEAIRNVAD